MPAVITLRKQNHTASMFRHVQRVLLRMNLIRPRTKKHKTAWHHYEATERSATQPGQSVRNTTWLLICSQTTTLTHKPMVKQSYQSIKVDTAHYPNPTPSLQTTCRPRQVTQANPQTQTHRQSRCESTSGRTPPSRPVVGNAGSEPTTPPSRRSRRRCTAPRVSKKTGETPV